MCKVALASSCRRLHEVYARRHCLEPPTNEASGVCDSAHADYDVLFSTTLTRSMITRCNCRCANSALKTIDTRFKLSPPEASFVASVSELY